MVNSKLTNYALHGLIILYLLYLSEKGAGTRQLMELEFNPVSASATTRLAHRYDALKIYRNMIVSRRT